MNRVLVISTSRKTRGGITAVLKAHERGGQWQKYHCHWIQTHRDGPNWRKILYMLTAWVDFLCRISFYDIIHVHFSLRTTARRKKPFVKIAKMLGKKIIIHLHCGSQIDDIWNSDYDYLFSHADVCLFLSDNLRKRVESHTGLGRDYRICYNPCSTIPKEPKYSKKKYVLFSGTLLEGKGYKDLIRAFGNISNKFPEWKLVFAGNGEIENGKQLAKDCGVEQKTIFLGWVDGLEKDKVFKEASIFCLPSYAEGFPMAVLDAWAYGLPVITTPVGGILDIAKDGENLLLFSPGDVMKLSACLDKLIYDSKLRDVISQNSTKLSETTFNWELINSQLSDLYQELATK